MAKRIKEQCHNCGNKDCVLFCGNEFTDFYCTKCGATNLLVTLPRVEEVTPCKNGRKHDIRISRQGLFCPICWTEFNKDGTKVK